MTRIPPYRYGSPEDRAVDMINQVAQGAPAEFDTLQEVAAEIQELRTQIPPYKVEHLKFLFYCLNKWLLQNFLLLPP